MRPIDAPVASMRPRSVERGKEETPDDQITRSIASMRPRSVERGKALRAGPELDEPPGFNEAALSRARKGRDPRTGRVAVTPLQ